MTRVNGQSFRGRWDYGVRSSEAVREVASLNERRRVALAEIDNATFSRFHVKVCLVAGVGFFTDAYDIFTIMIATIMLGIVYPDGTNPTTGLPVLSNWNSAGLKLASAVGNLIGQVLFGWLADVFGRKKLYGVELIIMIVGTFGQAVSGGGPTLNTIHTLIVWRVIMGVGVGGDYPLSAVICSEFASTRTRGRLMTAVFAFQGLGQLAASLVSLVVVAAFKDEIQRSPESYRMAVDYTWRLLIGIGCIPAVVALYFRLTIPETPRFTMDIDRNLSRAARDIANALATSNYGIYDEDSSLYEPRVIAPRATLSDFFSHFSRLDNLKVLVGTAYSWFALDIAFYILTLDSVQILDAIGMGSVPNDIYKSLLHLCVGNIILIVAGYLPGFVAAFALIDSWGRKPIQFMGFVILTLLLWIMGFGFQLVSSHSNKGFMALYCLANFFQNFGPNTTTFVVPGEAFPTRYRTTAYGISAASGKLGAVIAQVLFAAVNVDAHHNRVQLILEVLSFVMMTGVFSTLLIPETKQRTLEDISNEEQEMYIKAPRSVDGTATFGVGSEENHGPYA